MKKPIVGLTFGDANGIGPEIVAKAISKKEIQSLATWILIGDERVFNQGAELTGAKFTYQKIDTIDDIDYEEDTLWLLDTKNSDPADLNKGELSGDAGKIAGDNLITAVDLAKDKKIDSIVYASMNKDALYRGGFEFKDDINLLASLFNQEGGFGEVNVMDGTWFTRVTSHIPLKDVADEITKELVVEKLHFANDILKSVGFTNPSIAVAGLNPHASDNGLLGEEEFEIITPAIEQANEEGINALGPFPADTLFLRLQKENYDCVMSMYHDQGQIGMKLLGFDKGVTISGGLPVTITTPAHGTAFDISGKGIADSGALEEAMKLNVKMVSSNL